MAKLSKTQVIAALADKSGMSKKDVKEFLGMYEEMALKEVKKNGEFRDTAHPIDNDFRLKLEEAVLARYHAVVGEEPAVLAADIPTEDVTF